MGGAAVIVARSRRPSGDSRVAPRDLGSDAERATYRTLHLASRAAGHLRDGLVGGDTGKAARHLRTLLGSDVLAIADRDGGIVADGLTGPTRRSLRGSRPRSLPGPRGPRPS